MVVGAYLHDEPDGVRLAAGLMVMVGQSDEVSDLPGRPCPIGAGAPYYFLRQQCREILALC
jgi:hypothetical protein